jgi:ADP-ribose pyrophosphatase YjhB (NUDIX family)
MENFKYCPLCTSEMNRESELLLTCPDCGFHYYFNPKPCTAVILENSAKKILVVRRKREPFKDMLDLPGGFVDLHENLEQAIEREIKEELGIKATNLRYYLSLIDKYKYTGVEYPILTFVFTGTVPAEEKITPADDVYDPHFIKPEEINIEEVSFESMKQVILTYQTK